MRWGAGPPGVQWSLSYVALPFALGVPALDGPTGAYALEAL